MSENTSPERQPSRRPGSSLRSISPVWLAGAVLMLLVVSSVFNTVVTQRQTIQYSQFKQLLAEGRVAELVLNETTIRGTYQKPDQTIETFTTARVVDPKLVELLEAKGVRYQAAPDSRWVGELMLWVLPFLVLLGLWMFVFRRMGSAEGGLMSFGRSRAKVFSDDAVKVSFGDVAGVDEAALELREVVEFLKNPRKYTTIGGRIPKGVLLVGPPGTGKTLLARAVAGEAKVPFFSLTGSDFVEMFVGVGAARVRDLFRQAEVKAPCIVFIDELDALGKVRMQSPMGGHEEREQTLNQLLSEMDGFDSRKGVIVMAATNRPEVLDPALLRAGRFDRQVLVDKPDVKGREAILHIHVRQVKLADDVNLQVVAGRTAGFAGADLSNLVNEAALLAARRDKERVERKDFEEAIDRVIAGLEKKRTMNPRVRRVVAYHEAGHAIVATVLPGLDPVHKVSIVSRGFGALGYTMQLPTEDRYLITKTELEHQLAVLLAGRTAEQIMFSETSTGAQNDLLRATDIARAMVTEFGMSDVVGPVNHEGRRRNTFIEAPAAPERGAYGEETAGKIDSEVKRFVVSGESAARKVLEERRELLDRLAERLLEIEVVEGEELRSMLPAEPGGAPEHG